MAEEIGRCLEGIHAAAIWSGQTILYVARKAVEILVPAALYLLKCLRGMFRKKPHALDSPTAHATRQSSFMGRVMSHMVATAIFSAITNLVGFNVIVAVATLLFALPIWIMGGKVALPDFVRKESRGIVSRLNESIHDKKADLVEAYEDHKDAWNERISDKKERFDTRIDHKTGEVKTGLRREAGNIAGDAAHKAIWGR